MLFNSLTFVVFFVAVLGGYHLLRSWTARKAWLLAASYLFYGAWNPPFLLLLWFSTVVDWMLGNRLAAKTDKTQRKGLVVLSLLINLGLLGFFKYGNFLLDNFVTLLSMLGVTYRPPAMDIVLPVGISFYTFQTLSYTLDIYRGTLRPARSFLDFAFYVTFFPQLVAGPIVRAADFIPQCDEAKRFNAKALGWGLFLMTLGLFEKIVLADVMLSPAAETVFSHVGGGLHGLDAWLGVLAFSGQIYCDFAGYSTCAIGASLCFGFSLCTNFRAPYAAVGFADFWKRWHISLSTWLRDYLYISLGGNRRGFGRTLLNVALTMLLGGLWHGASWTFVAWGGLHGLYLVSERLLSRFTEGHRWIKALPVQILLGLGTYLLICITWVFFRAHDFTAARQILASLTECGGVKVLASIEMLKVAVVMVGLLLAHALSRNSTLEAIAERTPRPLIVIAWTAMLFLIIVAQGTGNAFIYFQF